MKVFSQSRIPVQDRLAIGGLALHGVQHIVQECKELLALVGDDAKLDEIGDRHRLLLRDDVGPSYERAGRRSMTSEVKKRMRPWRFRQALGDFASCTLPVMVCGLRSRLRIGQLLLTASCSLWILPACGAEETMDTA